MRWATLSVRRPLKLANEELGRLVALDGLPLAILAPRCSGSGVRSNSTPSWWIPAARRWRTTIETPTRAGPANESVPMVLEHGDLSQGAGRHHYESCSCARQDSLTSCGPGPGEPRGADAVAERLIPDRSAGVPHPNRSVVEPDHARGVDARAVGP